MPNLFSKIKENHIIKDERYLLEDYLPEKILFRDNEIDEIVFSLRPLTLAGKANNLFVSGKTGTGKTVSLRYVLNELESYTDRTLPIYINCYHYSSPSSILSLVSEKLSLALPRRGLSLQEYFTRIFEILKKKKLSLLLVFDEADQFLQSQDSSLLYDFARSQSLHKINIAIILISNNENLPSFLDEKIRNSLSLSHIIFENYTPQQLKEILNNRIQFALEKNTLHPETLGIITGYSARNKGDARIAINTLLLSARQAEKENSPIITPEHVYKIISYSSSSKINQILSSLSPEELEILSFVQETELPSSTIFENYSSSPSHLKERRFREIISKLINKKLLDSKNQSKGSHGTKRYIKLSFPTSILSDFLEQKEFKS